jgi:hydrogenase maturation protein HypF
MGGTVIAFGAWLKNACCLVDAHGNVHWSPLHGDLGTPQACAALDASADALMCRVGGRVDAVAHDLHPDFHSTRSAQALAVRLSVPAIGVQHHHAHIGVVMAEQGLAGPVVGVALDGVGLGSDGTAWGGELLSVHGATVHRLAHLQPLALPGGDAAAREPWRMAAAALHAMGRGDEIEVRFGEAIGTGTARGVAQMLRNGLRCPKTTSTGRWFDAAAAALGLSLKQLDEAEAAIALEGAATGWLSANPWPSAEAWIAAETGRTMDLRPVLARLFEIGPGGDVGEGAALFHAVLAGLLAKAVTAACADAGTRAVALGGGCFFNRLLDSRLSRLLSDAGLTVHRPQTVSCGDAGLALGQAWVAGQILAGSGTRPAATGQDPEPRPRSETVPSWRETACA